MPTGELLWTRSPVPLGYHPGDCGPQDGQGVASFTPSLDPDSSPSRVKPAIFDLLLAVCIGAYLGMAYTAVQVSSQGSGGRVTCPGEFSPRPA